ncbi:MAG: class I SAM-dependent methyltransferase [Caenispirillum sp.]|nr:class I SAM-dependent methyltransferase [Caenispirillum sp.]
MDPACTARPKPAAATPPSAWVRRWAALAPAGGTVLDVACGWGRHLRWFVDAGFAGTGVDRDTSMVDDLADRAEILRHDLEDGSPWPFAGRAFDVVVVTNYLHRPLFPALEEAVAPGGVLLYETFMRGNEAYGRPRNPDHLLGPGELLTAFPALQIVAFEQGRVETCGTGVVQRVACVRAAEPVALV